MKKVLATILALVMALGVTTMAWADESVTTVDALKTAVGTGGEVKLGASITASITIESGKTVTLDLNGFTLTNEAGQHTITNNGTLKIVDSSTAKTGKVDNVSHGKGALYNNVGATATLNGGTFDRSQEKGTYSPYENGGNSWYTIKNFGTMTVNAGVTVQQDGTANGGTTGGFSSLFANGWQSVGSGSEPEHTKDAVLTINGGTFKGGLNTVKNDDCGKLTIENGTFENYTQACVQNHNVATINGGEYTAEDSTYALYNCGCAADNDIGKLTITNGKFSGSVAIRSVDKLDNISISGGTFAGTIVKDKTESTITVSGGEFTADVSDYAADGMIVKTDGTTYTVVTDGGITGGTYTTKPTVADGYKVIENADGTFTVEKIVRYYYTGSGSTTTDTKKDDNKGTSPKTFDAGVGIYAVSAVLSVTGMAYVGKKKF